MKKLALMVLVGGCIVAYSLGNKVATASVPSSTDAAVTLVRQAFTATQAKLSAYEVHDWTTLRNQALSLSQIEDIGKNVATTLKINVRPEHVQSSKEEASVIFTGLRSPQDTAGSTQVSVQLMSMKLPQVPPQTVLVVREVTTTTVAGSMGATYQHVADAVSRVGGQPHINVTMIGYLQGTLPTGARAQVIQHAFVSTAGQPLQTMQDAYTSSTSGTVAAANVPFIESGMQKLNLQVALHKRNYQKDTKVLVGSPLITIEY